MNGPSREEFEARLDENKSWLASRIQDMQGDIQTVLRRMDERDAQQAERDRLREQIYQADLRRHEQDRKRFEADRQHDLEEQEKRWQRYERARELEWERFEAARHLDWDRFEAARQSEWNRFEAGRQKEDRRSEDFHKEIRRDIRQLKTTVIVTGISASLAILVGVAGFNATLLSGMIASFESGRNSAPHQLERKAPPGGPR